MDLVNLDDTKFEIANDTDNNSIQNSRVNKDMIEILQETITNLN